MREKKKKVKFIVDVTISYSDEKAFKEAILTVKEGMNFACANSSGFVITSGKVSELFGINKNLP